MKLRKNESGRFVFECKKQDRLVAKDAGFRFDGERMEWWTADVTVAAKLRNYADEPLKSELATVKDIAVLTFEGKKYVWRSSKTYKDLPKQAKFRWDPEAFVWWTTDERKAALLIQYADESAREQLAGVVARQEQAREASRAVDANVEIPVPGGLNPQTGEPYAYLGYQKAGIAFGGALYRQRNEKIHGVLIGDDMGLGKTVQVMGLINLLRLMKVLIICPASLKLVWLRHCQSWLVDKGLKILIADGSTPAWMIRESNIVIINYDVLKAHIKFHKGKVGRSKKDRLIVDDLGSFDCDWQLVVPDECHYMKGGSKVQRAALTQAIMKRAEFSAALTGTPIVNRPIELWPVVSTIAPGPFSSMWEYAKRYCDAQDNGWGYDVKGASNLDELQDLLRSTCMIRRLKKDVLTELPPKQRQVIEIVPTDLLASRAVREEQRAAEAAEANMIALRAAVELAKASEDPTDYEHAVERLDGAQRVAFTELSRKRHETAVAKIPYVIDHLKELIEDNPEYKVVVFAHHHDVIHAIADAFERKAVVVDGSVSSKAKMVGDIETSDRQQRVDAFMTRPDVQIIVGEFQPLGTGWTLTKSAHVVFAELDWVPGNMTQAEDRCHRIGQHDSVLVQHLVLEGSLDVTMAYTLIAKQKVIDLALDTKQVVRQVANIKNVAAHLEGIVTEIQAAKVIEDSEIINLHQASTKSLRRMHLDAVADQLTPDQEEAVYAAIRIVAGMCDGAVALDGQGFNKVDSRIGFELASQTYLTKLQAALAHGIVWKYKRQLPESLVERLRLHKAED